MTHTNSRRPDFGGSYDRCDTVKMTPDQATFLLNYLMPQLRSEQAVTHTILLAVPGAHLHTYGKDSRPGRKVGHCTLVDTDRSRLLERLAALRALIHRDSGTPTS